MNRFASMISLSVLTGISVNLFCGGSRAATDELSIPYFYRLDLMSRLKDAELEVNGGECRIRILLGAEAKLPEVTIVESRSPADCLVRSVRKRGNIRTEVTVDFLAERLDERCRIQVQQPSGARGLIELRAVTPS